MRKSILAATLSLTVVFASASHAQTGQVMVGSAPGKAGVAQTISVSATITAINRDTRTVQLKTADGKETAVVAGPEVRNFAQLKVGDRVDVGYVEALALELKKGGGQTVARTEYGTVGTAPVGGTPGGDAGRQVVIVADVVDIDAATQSVTLRGPERTVKLRVRDPEQFKLIAKGDQIEATYTEAAAVSVTPK